MLVYRFAQFCESSDVEDLGIEEVLDVELAASLETREANIL
jgi:hypothetical protein